MPKMVLVTWVDAKFHPDQHTEEGTKEHNMDEFYSLGYLIEQTSLKTTIASEQNNYNEYRNITLIPTGSIISIVDIKVSINA